MAMRVESHTSRTRRGVHRAVCRRLVRALGLGALIVVSLGACASDDDSVEVVATYPTADAAPSSTDAPPSTATSTATRRATQIEMTPIEITAPFDNVEAGEDAVRVENLLPWDGGFLALGTIEGASALNRPLPEEVAALFPPEVVALFPDGLPPTIEEATRLLEEAGLYETVRDIVAENAAARNAVFAVSQGPVRLAAWSEDGETWKPVEASLPETLDASSLVAAGDHLVGFGTPLPGIGNFPTETIVASTTDLVDWRLDEISPEPPADLPVGVMMTTTPEVIVANDSGWMLVHSTSLDFTAENLVSMALDVDIADVTVLFTLDDGVLARVPAADGIGTEELEVSWVQLGFAEALMPYLYASDRRLPDVPEIWAAGWGAEPAKIDPRLVDEMGDSPWDVARTGPFAATPAGFIELSGPVWFSADGIEWTETETPPEVEGWGGTIANVVPVMDGLAVIGPSAAAPVQLVDATGQDWEPIELPGLPDVNPWMVDEPGSLLSTLPPPWIVYASEPAENTPDAWIVATLDGVTWLIDDIADDTGGGPDRTAPRAALDGSTLLVVDGLGNALRYDLAG